MFPTVWIVVTSNSYSSELSKIWNPICPFLNCLSCPCILFHFDHRVLQNLTFYRSTGYPNKMYFIVPGNSVKESVVSRQWAIHCRMILCVMYVNLAPPAAEQAVLATRASVEAMLCHCHIGPCWGWLICDWLLYKGGLGLQRCFLAVGSLVFHFSFNTQKSCQV